MSERDAIEKLDSPLTFSQLRAGVAGLGLGEGETVLVHASLSALGWVCGGPQAVVEALLAAVGESGTIVMPTHTGGLSDPAEWSNPPVPESWYEPIRAHMPAYHPAITPTRAMGAIPECFRRWPGSVRSDHPLHSFAALGQHAVEITVNHEIDYGLGERSPLARIYELRGKVLLLGVGHDSNTSLHLAEDRADFRKNLETGHVPILRDGARVRAPYTDIERNSEDFEALGRAFESEHGSGSAVVATIGAATCRLLDQRALVDFAADWLTEHRR